MTLFPCDVRLGVTCPILVTLAWLMFIFQQRSWQDLSSIIHSGFYHIWSSAERNICWAIRLGESPLSLATFHCSNVKRVIIMSSSVCHWVTKCQIDESGLSFEYFPGYARGSVQSTVRAPNICQRGERAGGRCRTWLSRINICLLNNHEGLDKSK